jgi:hypothetical protein
MFFPMLISVSPCPVSVAAEIKNCGKSTSNSC